MREGYISVLRVYKSKNNHLSDIEYDFQLIAQPNNNVKRTIIHNLYKIKKNSSYYKTLHHYVPKMISFYSLLEFECEVSLLDAIL